jgi:hypothetical protein
VPPSPDAANHPSVQGELFISYASPDVARAETLHQRLAAEKFGVWFDKKRLNPGCDWHNEIEAACDAARLILPLLTPHWHRSEWTKYETPASPAVLPVIAEGTPDNDLTPPLRRWQAHPLDPLTVDEPAWQALFVAIPQKLAEPVPQRAPFLVRLAHAPNRWFTGREADMNRLHDALHPGPLPAPTEARAWAITGLGGLGKTTLANEYVRRFRRRYPQVLWVDAGRGYQAEFSALHDQMFPDRARPDLPDEHKAAQVMDALREPHARLLVLDNVTDETTAAAWIPREGGCRTLLTSRFTGFSPRGADHPAGRPVAGRGARLPAGPHRARQPRPRPDRLRPTSRAPRLPAAGAGTGRCVHGRAADGVCKIPFSP